MSGVTKKKKKLHYLFPAFLAVCLLGIVMNCTDPGRSVKPPDNRDKVTISQGVWGNVWFWKGNFMPGSASGTITPVVREIYVYEATSFTSVEIDTTHYPLIREIHSQFIGKALSDEDGFFQIHLPAGKYSFFPKEGSLFFGNVSDSAGDIQAATVEPGKVTKRQIDINYQAVY